ncbi:MAG TPA: hypothetical protein VGZ32_28430 [Actinocrinis sp.]|jgi:hypothetical protein|uniref:hypothetical protein n=1 Tax=Actinocrinis sp. TaxID=1920516 RepID=UPI002DDD1C1F|nr:hypothetical protein [Actinocrinis sp.]HEV3174310.1 hypothetical protein [Actinocrinis sp.]
MERNRSVGENVEDARLLAKLGVMFDHVDPVPDAVTAGARAAFAWRDFDAAVARLIESESLADAGVRANGEHRLLTFEAPGLTVAVEATEIHGARRLVGQMVPAGPDHVSLEIAHRADESVQAPVDHLGRFTLSSVPAGLVRLRCSLPDGTRVVTEWVDT